MTPSVSWSSDLVGLARGLELEGRDHSVTSVLPPLLSSHNWNTLFMGPNAVADAIAQKYNATKSQVFDHVSEGGSACGLFQISSSVGQASRPGQPPSWLS